MDRVRTLAELGAAVAATYLAHMGAYPWQTGTVGAPKVDPLPGWSWLKGDPALDSEMQPNAFEHRRAR
jgi:hypothetical protein